jgi:hypothetical protein
MFVRTQNIPVDSSSLKEDTQILPLTFMLPSQQLNCFSNIYVSTTSSDSLSFPCIVTNLHQKEVVPANFITPLLPWWTFFRIMLWHCLRRSFSSWPALRTTHSSYFMVLCLSQMNMFGTKQKMFSSCFLWVTILFVIQDGNKVRGIYI